VAKGRLTDRDLQIAPVCTTELGLVAALQDEFDERNVKVIGLSANELESHEKWIADINEVNNVDLKFPIIADPKREISALYDMLDYQVSFLISRIIACKG
jgi:alkyl hydroperoxide reductase subunit AhpC